jgi:hypothetical protein
MSDYLRSIVTIPLFLVLILFAEGCEKKEEPKAPAQALAPTAEVKAPQPAPRSAASSSRGAPSVCASSCWRPIRNSPSPSPSPGWRARAGESRARDLRRRDPWSARRGSGA